MPKLIESVEKQIIGDIVSGKYPPGNALPLEREWAEQLGVGRPTLREALKKLESEGWINTRKGSASKVNPYMESGNIEILARLGEQDGKKSKEMIRHFLDFRALISPVYFEEALQNNPAKIIALLSRHTDLEDNSDTYAEYDWELQKKSALLASNPVYRLLLNSFDRLYRRFAADFFSAGTNRRLAEKYYSQILNAVLERDSDTAVDLFEEMIIESANNWLEK
jgi:GntR family negative regulator for fad regulon and positive regulator of fabA